MVQKNMDQLPLIIAGLSLCRYAPSLILFFPLLVFFLFVPFIPALLGPRKIPILFFLVASQQLHNFRFAQIGDPNDFIGFIAKNFNIDCPRRVCVQCAESPIALGRPGIQKNVDQPALVVIILAVYRHAYRLVFPILRLGPFLFLLLFQRVQFVVPIQRVEQQGLKDPFAVFHRPI